MSGKAYELAFREFPSEYDQVAVLTICWFNLSSKYGEKTIHLQLMFKPVSVYRYDTVQKDNLSFSVCTSPCPNNALCSSRPLTTPD